jgi:hypothetical protein
MRRYFHAQSKVAHLAAASTHLTIRVRALHSEGGIRIGMAAAGCVGLTEGRKTDGFRGHSKHPNPSI